MEELKEGGEGEVVKRGETWLGRKVTQEKNKLAGRTVRASAVRDEVVCGRQGRVRSVEQKE